MVRSFWIWLALVLSGDAVSLSATGPLPPRPTDGIYDEGEWLKEPLRAELVRQILVARESGDLGVFVVILDEKPDEVGALVGRLGREWGKEGLWGLVLHVVDEPGYPKCDAGLSRLPGWSEEQRSEFEQSLAGAVGKVAEGAKNLSGERERVVRATGDLADELGYLALVMARIDHHNAQVTRARLDPQKDGGGAGRTGFWVIIAIVMLLLVVAPLIFLVLKKEEQSEGEGGGFRFPDTRWRKRFRAPWSGGGNVLVEFRKLRRNPNRTGPRH